MNNLPEPIERPELASGKSLDKKYRSFRRLIDALRQRELPAGIVEEFDRDLALLNGLDSGNKEFPKKLAGIQRRLLRRLERELKLVPKNYYRNLWMGTGMAAFGLPIGVVFGTTLDNMAFLSIGLPIGMAIGIAVGTAMDEKARNSGNQFDVDLPG
jgi:hypothetical protein